VRFTEKVQDVLAESDLVVADNTSVLFEAAAAGWPVVVLDSSRFRRSANHGLRFWDWADVGWRTSNPDNLVRSVEWAWDDPGEWADVTAAMRAAVFPHWGEATSRAVAAITEWADQ
jgi:CDP-glycerol glycerophosphotransferase (TagB/SpsB family)